MEWHLYWTKKKKKTDQKEHIHKYKSKQQPQLTNSTLKKRLNQQPHQQYNFEKVRKKQFW